MKEVVGLIFALIKLKLKRGSYLWEVASGCEAIVLIGSQRGWRPDGRGWELTTRCLAECTRIIDD